MRTQADTSQAGVCARDESEWLCTDWRPRRDKLFLILMAIAAIIAIAQVLAHSGDTASSLSNDAVSYHNLAVGLLKGNGYSSTFWPPGYPAFLAVIYKLTGGRLSAVYLVQAVLFVITLMLLYRIALHITASRRVAGLAIAICLLRPSLRDTIPQIMTESLSALLLVAMLWQVYRQMARPRIVWALAIGGLAGFLGLTKPASLPCILVMMLFLVFSGRDRLARVGQVLLIAFVASAFIVPWTVRNYMIADRFVLVSTNAGFDFWLGNYPGTYLKDRGWREFPPEIAPLVAGKTEVEEDQILMRAGMSYIRDNPMRAVKLFGLKFCRLWLGSLGFNPRANNKNTNMPHIGSFGIPRQSVVPVLIFVLAVYGWVALPKSSKRRAYPMVAVLGCWTAVYVLVLATGRLAIPAQGFEFILAAVGVRHIWVAHLKRRFDKAKPCPSNRE